VHAGVNVDRRRADKYRARAKRDAIESHGSTDATYG